MERTRRSAGNLSRLPATPASILGSIVATSAAMLYQKRGKALFHAVRGTGDISDAHNGSLPAALCPA